jgi:hypothetical protein
MRIALTPLFDPNDKSREEGLVPDRRDHHLVTTEFVAIMTMAQVTRWPGDSLAMACYEARRITRRVKRT